MAPANTDAGADDLQALATKLRQKHRSGSAAQQQQRSSGKGTDAAAFLAGSVTANVANGISKDGRGEQLQPKRKKAMASEGSQPEQQRRNRAEENERPVAGQPVAGSVEQKKSGKKRKVKGADGDAPAAQRSKRQHAVAQIGQITEGSKRTKKLKRTVKSDD